MKASQESGEANLESQIKQYIELAESYQQLYRREQSACRVLTAMGRQAAQSQARLQVIQTQILELRSIVERLMK